MKTEMNGKDVQDLWRVNTVSMFKEMVNNNPGMGIFKSPINILGQILAQVSNRAIELNDPKLNRLMCRLALYEQSDPYSPNYDKEMMAKVFSDDYVKEPAPILCGECWLNSGPDNSPVCKCNQLNTK